MVGIHPESGETIPENDVLSDPLVLSAVRTAMLALRKANDKAEDHDSQDIKVPLIEFYDPDHDNPLNDDPEQQYRTRKGNMNAGRPWKKEDDDMLRRMLAENTPMSEICQKLQRRYRGVLKRMQLLQITDTADQNEVSARKEKYPRAGTRFLPEEEDELSPLFTQKKTIFELSEHFQRTPRAIVMRLQKMGLLGTDDPEANEILRK